METDIIERILKDFGSKSSEAIEILQDFEIRSKLGPRVIRCVVFLAKGDITKLNKSIKNAEADWRDVIVDAEREDFEFNKPFE